MRDVLFEVGSIKVNAILANAWATRQDDAPLQNLKRRGMCTLPPILATLPQYDGSPDFTESVDTFSLLLNR